MKYIQQAGRGLRPNSKSKRGWIGVLISEIKDAFPFLFLDNFYFLNLRLETMNLAFRESAQSVIDFCEALTPFKCNLDNYGKMFDMQRMVWMDKPDTEGWKFRFCPTYSHFTEAPILLYRFEETDASLRGRMKSKMEKNHANNKMVSNR